jgi:hypothetical protein
MARKQEEKKIPKHIPDHCHGVFLIVNFVIKSPFPQLLFLCTIITYSVGRYLARWLHWHINTMNLAGETSLQIITL